MNICIVGTGYVGLVTGACFADHGHRVTCVDYDQSKVDSIRNGIAPIHEISLDQLLARTIGRTLFAQTGLEGAAGEADLVLICVGTPFRDGSIDLSQVIDAAEQIGIILQQSKNYKVVAVKSTVIPGTTDGIVRNILESSSGLKAGKDFGLGMNPEFLTEGSAVEDFMNPDRIVIGGIDDRTREVLQSVYKEWPEVPRILTNNSTAEMIKYASNSVLATMISFSNEIARLCAAIGSVDVADVMDGVHKSAYFTQRFADGQTQTAPITGFLGAGCGFGGSCLPKDVSALAAQGKKYGLDMQLLSSVLEINRTQPEHFVRLADKYYPDMKGINVAILGIAFKPDTDDVRESPAFPIMTLLKQRGALIKVYDPVAKPVDHPSMKGVELAGSMVEAVRDAEIVFLVTRWQEFKNLSEVLDELERHPLVIDGRRLLNPNDYSRFEGIGR